MWLWIFYDKKWIDINLYYYIYMKVNILFITNFNYQCLGGVENYNRLIYSNFKNIQFHELPLLHSDKIVAEKLDNVKVINHDKYFNTYDTDNFIKKIKIVLNRKKWTNELSKFINDYIEQNKIEKIIISGDYLYAKKIFKKYINKIYFIQHATPLHYSTKREYDTNKYSYKKISLFKYIFNKIFNRRDFIKSAHNIVIFTELDKKFFIENFKDALSKKWYIIPLPTKYEIAMTTDHYLFDFIVCGRMDKTKNIDLICKFAKNHKELKFVACGDGDEMVKLLKCENFKVYHSLNKLDLLKVYKQSKYLLSFSKYEGFPFVAVESISNGLPCILINGYPSAKFLIGNNERGLLINENFTDYDNKIIEYINNINYSDISNNCINFAKNKLQLSSFLNAWSEILMN